MISKVSPDPAFVHDAAPLDDEPVVGRIVIAQDFPAGRKVQVVPERRDHAFGPPAPGIVQFR